MKPARVAGVCLLIAVLLSAVLAAGASAEAPEFGRCLKKAERSLTPGSYDSAKCIKEASEDAGTEAEKLKKGNFEWLPGAVAGHTGFTFVGGAVTLTGHGTWTCTSTNASGDYSLSDSKKLTFAGLEFHGCKANGFACTSEGHENGTIAYNELAGEVGYEIAAKNKTALKLYPATGEKFIEYKCVGLEVKVRGKGEEGGILVNIKNDAMKSEETLKYKATGGIQKPSNWEGSPSETYLEQNFENLGYTHLGWELEGKLRNQEEFEYELNAVV